MLDERWIDFSGDRPNPLEYIEISATTDFEYIAFNNKLSTLRGLAVYSPMHSRLNSSLQAMASIKIDS